MNLAQQSSCSLNDHEGATVVDMIKFLLLWFQKDEVFSIRQMQEKQEFVKRNSCWLL